MNSTVRLIVVATGLLAMMVAVYLWRPHGESLHKTSQPTPRSAPVDGHETAAATPSSGAGVKRMGDDTQKSTDYPALLKASHDHWAFAERILPAARAGDANAQLYLWKALDECAQDNHRLFERRGQVLTLEQSLQQPSNRVVPPDLIRRQYAQCHKFLTNDTSEFGNTAGWLAAATDSRQPVAQAITASQSLMQQSADELALAAGVPNPSDQPPVVSAMGPRELLLEAVQSRDPEVLFWIGDMQQLLDPASSDTSINRYAWMLLACQGGFDCTNSAQWVELNCGSEATCSSLTGPTDYIQHLSGANWPAVQQRAQDISAKLNAGQWDALGLGT